MMKKTRGSMLVEILLAIGLAGILLPTLVGSIVVSRFGKVQQLRKTEATMLVREAEEAVRSARDQGWNNFALNGTYYPTVSGGSWILESGSETINGFTRELTIDDVYRNTSHAIVTTGGAVDPSTKKVDISVTWGSPLASTITSTLFITRNDNLTYSDSTQVHFDAGLLAGSQTTLTDDGEVILSNNTKAKWCSPDFASSTIDLPDGPPVAVAAAAATSVDLPNDVFVATSPYATSTAKLAYVNVAANTDPPVSTLRGIFTMDPSQYSGSTFPTGTGLTNDFITNDIQYYKSAAGKTYALLATDIPDKEVVAVQINNGTTDAFQDPVNKIYTYWTSFNTRAFNASAGMNTGFMNPSSNSAAPGGDNNGFASNPTRAYTNNNSYAVDTNSGNGTGTTCTGSDKDRHMYYNYNFNLPSGATINGIEVLLDARVDSQSGNPFMCVELSWNGGSSWTNVKSTPMLNTSAQSFTLGGESDLWGRTWSDGNFSNSNFRIRITNVASNTSRDFSLDWAAVNVHYSGGTTSNDQAPYGYGATAITVSGDVGYVASGGYLYSFNLSNIDSKSPSSELDQVGCRIQLDGYDCRPSGPGVSAQNAKYSSGQSGTSWSDTATPANNNCADGGNIELFATNDLSPVQVNGHNYIYVAVGAGTNPEFNIVDATNVPDGSSSPAINSPSCGRISGGNSGWKRISSYDFNTGGGTEEASNSVYAKSDGTRAYISSNGTSDSKQFYILNTSNPYSPSFLSGNPSSGPTSGFYQGSGTLGEMYPRRSLTVLNGDRVVLVGKDGVTNGNDTEEYQVLNSENEASPTYCGGVNFDEGFNDLTSVSEADSDNFVYMVANTTSNELKIIQGGPDGLYVEAGTIESAIFDAGYSKAFNRFDATITTPAETSIRFQFAVADPVSGSCTGATYSFTGPDGTPSTYYATTSAALAFDNDGTGYENPGRCFKYKAYLSTTDYNATPVLHDITINHSP